MFRPALIVVTAALSLAAVSEASAGGFVVVGPGFIAGGVAPPVVGAVGVGPVGAVGVGGGGGIVGGGGGGLRTGMPGNGSPGRSGKNRRRYNDDDDR